MIKNKVDLSQTLDGKCQYYCDGHDSLFHFLLLTIYRLSHFLEHHVQSNTIHHSSKAFFLNNVCVFGRLVGGHGMMI